MNAIGVTSFPRSVLVVDDEEVVRHLLGRALVDRGWQVVEATDGETAVKELERQGFGCMLVDKNLPGIDGLEVIRRGRLSQPYCAALIITAFASLDSAVEAMRMGANDYLIKPFEDLGIVALKVEQAMKNAQAHFENDRLLNRIRDLAQEATSREEKISMQATEIEMFEKVLEFSVQQEVEGLRKRLTELERELDDSRNGVPKVLENTSSVLQRARAVFRNQDVDVEALRGTLEQVVRVLEANVELLSQLTYGGGGEESSRN